MQSQIMTNLAIKFFFFTLECNLVSISFVSTFCLVFSTLFYQLFFNNLKIYLETCFAAKVSVAINFFTALALNVFE